MCLGLGSVSVVEDTLTVEAVLLKAGEAPYVIMDTIGVNAYQITDAAGDVLVEGTSSLMYEIVDGLVYMEFPLDEIENGTYKLAITEFVGGLKAEQPLMISGYWECEFEL